MKDKGLYYFFFFFPILNTPDKDFNLTETIVSYPPPPPPWRFDKFRDKSTDNSRAFHH